MKILLPLFLGIATLGLGCSTHVGIASTHREDLSSQSRVFAIASRNLEDATRGRGGSADEQAAAGAVSALHTAAENFARGAGRWASEDDVNTRYEVLITAWVKVKQTFPNLKADKLTTDSYDRVAHEWEQLARATGYANKKLEESLK